MEVFTNCSECESLVDVYVEVESDLLPYSDALGGDLDYSYYSVGSYECDCGHSVSGEY